MGPVFFRYGREREIRKPDCQKAGGGVATPNGDVRVLSFGSCDRIPLSRIFVSLRMEEGFEGYSEGCGKEVSSQFLVVCFPRWYHKISKIPLI